MKEQEHKTELPNGVKWPNAQKWKWFSIDCDGVAFFYEFKPKYNELAGCWDSSSSKYAEYKHPVTPEFDAGNSLVKRV